MARVMAPVLSAELGQPVVVENRTGAGQTLAVEVLAKADPDGYTIGLVDSGPLTISPHLRKLPYDPLQSLASVASIANLPLVVLASNTSGLSSLQDIARVAQKDPKALSYATTGSGSMHNLIGESIKSRLKLQIEHVPYKGAAQAVPDVVSGRVALMLSAVASGARFVQEKQMRAIAVTSASRSAAMPDVPTLAEQGMEGFDAQGWVGMFAPRNTPPAVLSLLAAATRAAMHTPALIQQEVSRGGNELLKGTPEELQSMLARDYARWGAVVRENGIKAD